MIALRPFEESDIPRLISWVPDAQFLLQWAGPQYGFPLDAAQLIVTMEKATGAHPSHLMFKALLEPGGEVIGHIEFMSIDYERRSMNLGRVLIGDSEWRGQGYGKAMVRAAIDCAFRTMNLEMITLGVFDFNTRAIATYQAIGFIEYERELNARQFGEKFWNLVKMRLKRDAWISKQQGEQDGDVQAAAALEPKP